MGGCEWGIGINIGIDMGTCPWWLMLLWCGVVWCGVVCVGSSLKAQDGFYMMLKAWAILTVID